MSRLVNFVFDGAQFVGIEDVRTGQPINVGKVVHLDDDLTAIQVRVMDIHLPDTEAHVVTAPTVKVEPMPYSPPPLIPDTRRSLP